jgi:FkbM family methyltransferase
MKPPAPAIKIFFFMEARRLPDGLWQGNPIFPTRNVELTGSLTKTIHLISGFSSGRTSIFQTPMASRLTNLLRGLQSNLKFSNRFQLIYDRIFRRDLRLTHYIWKNSFVFICNSELGDHIAVQECLCERAYDAFLDQCHFVSNRINYVNIGANIGAFDLLLLERGLTIEAGLAVELNPRTFARCLVNLQSNGLFLTQAVNAGIAGSDGHMMFHPLKLSLSDSIFAPQTPDGGMEVELLTLDTLLERHAGHFSRFDLLKLDCEQAEYAIIRLTPASLFRKFRYVIVEFHPEPENESVEAAYAKLQEAGFLPLRNRRSKFQFVDLFIRS